MQIANSPNILDLIARVLNLYQFVYHAKRWQGLLTNQLQQQFLKLKIHSSITTVDIHLLLCKHSGNINILKLAIEICWQAVFVSGKISLRSTGRPIGCSVTAPAGAASNLPRAVADCYNQRDSPTALKQLVGELN